MIGGRFAPPYKYMVKYIKLMCCQKYLGTSVSQGVLRVQVLKISKEEPWDTLIPKILLGTHDHCIDASTRPVDASPSLLNPVDLKLF